MGEPTSDHGNCSEMKKAEFEPTPGDLVVHNYKPDTVWITSSDDPMSSHDIPWGPDEVGTVLQVTPWSVPGDPDRDTFIQILIPAGVGWLFGSDVAPVKSPGEE